MIPFERVTRPRAHASGLTHARSTSWRLAGIAKRAGIFGFLAASLLPPSLVEDLEAQVGDSYVAVENWPALPAGFQTGHVSAVDVDSHGHVFAFRRAGREFDVDASEPITVETILMLDGEDGSLLAMWGAGMFLVPHGLTLDRDDNVWVTDAISHQVFKFSHDGVLLLTLGEYRVPGRDGTHFRAPTEVAVQSDGSFFVADGYGNLRIAKFSPDGVFLYEWGSKGTARGEFDIPHGVDVDGGGRVWVADRENSRVQVFDGEGQFETEWDLSDVVGRVANVAPLSSGGAWVAGYREQSPVARLNAEGEVEALVSPFGMRTVHDVAVGPHDVIYVSGSAGIRKIVRRP